jgi:hypothetical protein
MIHNEETTLYQSQITYIMYQKVYHMGILLDEP